MKRYKNKNITVFFVVILLTIVPNQVFAAFHFITRLSLTARYK